MKNIFIILSLYLSFVLADETGANFKTAPQMKEENMQIVLQFENEKILIELDESAAAKEFAALLPLRLKWSDYAGKEKISPALKQRLTQKGKSGYEPALGDFFYFAPWGNLGISTPNSPPTAV